MYLQIFHQISLKFLNDAGLILIKKISFFITFLLIGTQQIFQRRFNVAFRLIWRRDIAQRRINVETTLCTSTLKFTKFNNVETTLCISTLNWTTLSFSTLIFTTLDNVETTLRIWPFEKKLSLDAKAEQYFWVSRNMLDSKSSSIFPHFKRNL